MTHEPRPVEAKSLEKVILEWDAVASARDAEIRSGTDISYHHVLMPLIMELMPKGVHQAVLDLGCGTGFLACKLATKFKSVVAIDPSQVSIGIAQGHCPSTAVKFVRSSAEDFAASNVGHRFPIIVANMVLQSVPNLDAFVAAMASLAADGAAVVITLPHPWFWATYWNYASAPWFSYASEIPVEAPFRISLSTGASGTTTHIHRPLHRYFDAFFQHHFATEIVHEPMPPTEIQNLYPAPWRFPRFLGMRLRFTGRTKRAPSAMVSALSEHGTTPELDIPSGELLTPISKANEVVLPTRTP